MIAVQSMLSSVCNTQVMAKLQFRQRWYLLKDTTVQKL